MKIELKNTVKRHIAHLHMCLIHLLFFSLLTFYYYSKSGDYIEFYIFGFVFLVIHLNTFYLHIQYVKEDFGKRIYIDTEQKSILIKKNKIQKEYRFEDITYTILTQLDYVRIARYDKYFYYQIGFKNNESIFITSLLVPDSIPFKVDLIRKNSGNFIAYCNYENHLKEIERQIAFEQQLQQQEKKQKVIQFKEKYSEYSLTELQEVIDGNIYVSEAKEAAAEILQMKVQQPTPHSFDN